MHGETVNLKIYLRDISIQVNNLQTAHNATFKNRRHATIYKVLQSQEGVKHPTKRNLTNTAQ